MRPPREDTKPWFRQFWPWFLIALPASAVIGSFITIKLAVTDSDTLVRDDYYKEGLAINQDRARQYLAASLGVAINLTYEPDDGRLTATMNEAAVGSLTHLELTLSHPTMAAEDRRYDMEKVGERTYAAGEVAPIPSTNWHVTIAPPEGTWKISKRWDSQRSRSLDLSPEDDTISAPTQR